jgi:glycosyltransferase involved in cell wall biosynthesis
MTAARYDVCIVSTASVSTGPRVEKEAGVLVGAGYRVAVLVSHSLPTMVSWDARLAAGRGWELHTLDWLSDTRKRTVRGLAAMALHNGARRACLAGAPAVAPLAQLACSNRMLPLALRAAQVPARLYIGHNLGALPAAAFAARLRRVPYAFDAEDDHFGELSRPRQASGEGAVTNAVMDALRGAAYVTAASDGIADALRERHGIARPTTVLNAFPASLRDQLDGQRKDRTGEALSLCWYSQHIGLDRGLQEVIAALGMVRGDFELHLRGDMATEVEATLRALAREHGIEARVRFHPQVHPDELLSRIAEHDIGLALEQDVNDNRLIAVTNKLLFYLLAGLAVIATDTPGQRGIAAQASGAIDLYPRGDARALAAAVQRLLDDRGALRQHKRRALDAALTRFNAERELQKIPPLVARALAHTER